MLKKIALVMLLALPMGVFAQNLKFGHINAQEIITVMPEFTKAQNDIQTLEKQLTAELQRTQEEFNKKYQEFNALDASTPETIKERRVQEMQELDAKIQKFRETADQDLRRQQQQLMAPIQENVMKAIQSVGAEGNYTFIFENGMSLYTGTDVTDVTPLMKARLGIK